MKNAAVQSCILLGQYWKFLEATTKKCRNISCFPPRRFRIICFGMCLRRSKAQSRERDTMSTKQHNKKKKRNFLTNIPTNTKPALLRNHGYNAQHWVGALLDSRHIGWQLLLNHDTSYQRRMAIGNKTGMPKQAILKDKAWIKQQAKPCHSATSTTHRLAPSSTLLDAYGIHDHTHTLHTWSPYMRAVMHALHYSVHTWSTCLIIYDKLTASPAT